MCGCSPADQKVLKDIQERCRIGAEVFVARVSGRPRGAPRTTGDDPEMQYLVSIINDTAGLATPDELAAINAFNDRLKAEDHWVFAGGLAAPSSATVIDNRGEEAVFTDGPSWSRRSSSPASGS
jgi:hypothetical protein